MVKESNYHIYLSTVILISVILMGVMALYSQYKGAAEDKQALEEGIESTVEVLDKKIYTSTGVAAGAAMRSTRYELKVYIHGEVRELEVNNEEYNNVEIGDTINVMLNDEVLVMLYE